MTERARSPTNLSRTSALPSHRGDCSRSPSRNVTIPVGLSASTEGEVETLREWIFTPADVHITDSVIGRGAFGEVRIAKWRNMSIACKRLHVASEGEIGGSIEGIDPLALQQEIKMLTSLRHPNLVLFLGVCVSPESGNGTASGTTISSNRVAINGIQFSPRTTCILTELLPFSLYDLLEVKKITLNLPDILDIARDVASGLDYLHRHEPSAIVHRDISSKNILLGGNRAKIADLGQAKLFASSTMSRQTGMPGAMAYSAPEVLTGKYSAKIDIFSFGILLAQMCTSEYPRIDRREEQINAACISHPLLERLIRQTVCFQPQERPFSHAVCNLLSEFISNDRHYPNSRRSQPQSEVGVIARSWMEQQIDTQSREVQIELDRTRSLLQAEEQRWRLEAGKVDGINTRLQGTEESLRSTMETLSAVQSEKERLEQQLRNAEDSRDQLRNQLQAIGTDTQRMNQQIQNYQTQLVHQAEKLNVANSTIGALESSLGEQEHLLEVSRRSEEDALRSKEQLKLQLNMQVEHARDLETRLEQALTRWRLDKDNLRSEAAKVKKANAQSAALVEKNERQRAELERYESRLQQYDDLPLPDEIKARIRDMQRDLDQSSDEIRHLMSERDDLQSERLELEDIVQDKQSYIEELREDILQKESLIQDREVSIRQLNSELKDTQLRVDAHDAEKANLNAAIEELKAADGALKHELANLRVELNRERRVVEVLRETVATHNTSRNGRNVGAPVTVEASMSQLLNSSSLREHGTMETGATAGTGAGELLENSQYTTLPQQSSSYHTAEGEDGDYPEIGENAGSNSGSNGIIDTNAVSAEPAMASIATAASLLAHRNANTRTAGTNEEISDSAVKHAISRAAELYDPEAFPQEVATDVAAEEGPTSPANATKRVIALMQSNSKDERFIWRGARALRDLILKDAEPAKASCYLSRMEDWLLPLMLELSASAVVQGHCMRLIGALAFGSDVFRRKMGEKGQQGIIKLVVMALETHCKDETVLLHATTAITNLTHNSMENRSRFVEYGGIEPLIRMMIYFSKDSAKLLRQACWAVLTLSAADDIAKVIAMHGADSAILNAMLHHRWDAGVQRFGCWALSNLALADEEIAKKIKKKGIIEVCRIILETHSDDAEVVRQAKHTLGVFSPLNVIAAAAAARPASSGTGKNATAAAIAAARNNRHQGISTSMSSDILHS